MSRALVRVRDVHKYFTRGSERIDVLQGRQSRDPEGRLPGADGAVGLGQDDAAEPDRRPRHADRAARSKSAACDISRARRRRACRGGASQHIGFVFQLYNLLPVLTAERNVELPLLLTKLSKAERRKRVAIALKVVGLADRAKHYPRQLSGGQEQRVGIARAIVTDPTLLLCDEPTGDLDRKAGDEILDLLQALNRDHGKTIVMVTHDPHAAERAHADAAPREGHADGRRRA